MREAKLRGHASEGRAPRPRRAISPQTLSSRSRVPNAPRGPSPRTFSNSDGTEVGILRIDHRPEALACEIHDEQGASEIAGLLLLDEVPNVVAREERWQIGVDFGTTNTSIHFLHQGASTSHPSQMSFSRRLTAPIGDIDVGKVVLQRDFLPDDIVAMPFLSILEERTGAQASDHAPIVGARVHYVRDIASTLAGFTSRHHDREMRFDLKWSRDRSNLERVEAAPRKVVAGQCIGKD
jgi:hypothetical protein